MPDRFRPLDMMRAIRDDRSLTTTESELLHCAVLRTDNKSCKVRMSLAGLAEDAKTSTKTAERAFRKPGVTRYFETVERQTRSVNLWFWPTPDMVSAFESEPEESTPDMVSTTPDMVSVSGGHGVRPSALSAYTSTQAIASALSVESGDSPSLASSFDAPEEESLKYEISSCIRHANPKLCQMFGDDCQRPKVVRPTLETKVCRLHPPHSADDCPACKRLAEKDRDAEQALKKYGEQKLASFHLRGLAESEDSRAFA